MSAAFLVSAVQDRGVLRPSLAEVDPVPPQEEQPWRHGLTSLALSDEALLDLDGDGSPDNGLVVALPALAQELTRIVHSAIDYATVGSGACGAEGLPSCAYTPERAAEVKPFVAAEIAERLTLESFNASLAGGLVAYPVAIQLIWRAGLVDVWQARLTFDGTYHINLKRKAGSLAYEALQEGAHLRTAPGVIALQIVKPIWRDTASSHQVDLYGATLDLTFHRDHIQDGVMGGGFRVTALVHQAELLLQKLEEEGLLPPGFDPDLAADDLVERLRAVSDIPCAGTSGVCVSAMFRWTSVNTL